MKEDNESYLIRQLHSSYIGDDGAVVGDMIYSVDAFCEGTHFLREWMSLEQIGRKAMLVNISDAVAMNAKPLYALVSVMIPKSMQKDEIDSLIGSLEDTAREFDCEIIGGDTVGGESLHISITLISKSNNPLLRKGLKVGDLLAFTGTLGESKRDLEALMRGESISKESRFYEPKLRQEFISLSRPYLRAGMDISDGLYCDSNKLLRLNKLGLETIVDIPTYIGESGEEYEMLIAFDPKERLKVEECAKKSNTKLTIFARVAKSSFSYPCSSHHF